MEDASYITGAQPCRSAQSSIKASLATLGVRFWDGNPGTNETQVFGLVVLEQCNAHTLICFTASVLQLVRKHSELKLACK